MPLLNFWDYFDHIVNVVGTFKSASDVATNIMLICGEFEFDIIVIHGQALF